MKPELKLKKTMSKKVQPEPVVVIPPPEATPEEGQPPAATAPLTLTGVRTEIEAAFKRHERADAKAEVALEAIRTEIGSG
jgi:hypothetical protein